MNRIVILDGGARLRVYAQYLLENPSTSLLDAGKPMPDTVDAMIERLIEERPDLVECIGRICPEVAATSTDEITLEDMMTRSGLKNLRHKEKPPHRQKGYLAKQNLPFWHSVPKKRGRK